MEALGKNTLLDEGIELTYRFASPGNKRYTGPLNRFTEMVCSAPYSQLLNYLNARYGPLSVSGREAYQVMTITDKAGEEFAYVWALSCQSEGEFKGCWMTEAVIRAQRSVQRKLVQTLSPFKIAFASSLAVRHSVAEKEKSSLP